MVDERDIAFFQNPNDHKGVSESVLSVVENGRWVTKAESVSY